MYNRYPQHMCIFKNLDLQGFIPGCKSRPPVGGTPLGLSLPHLHQPPPYRRYVRAMSIICAIYIKEILYKIFPCGLVVPPHTSHCNTGASWDMIESETYNLGAVFWLVPTHHVTCVLVGTIKIGVTLSGEIDI